MFFDVAKINVKGGDGGDGQFNLSYHAHLKCLFMLFLRLHGYEKGISHRIRGTVWGKWRSWRQRLFGV